MQKFRGFLLPGFKIRASSGGSWEAVEFNICILCFSAKEKLTYCVEKISGYDAWYVLRVPVAMFYDPELISKSEKLMLESILK